MKSLLLATLFVAPLCALAKTPAYTEAQHSKHFEFRAKAYVDAKKSNRKPASSDDVNDMADAAQQAEQRAILAEFRKDYGSEFSIQEMVARYAERGGSPKVERVASGIPALVVKQANDKKTRTYKALRYAQIANIDGRNSEGGFAFPIEAKDVKIMGPVFENVDLRERCQYDEKKQQETSCSQGWNQWAYFVTVNAESCHNSGCDTSPHILQVDVTYVPAVYDGSAMEEKARPKRLKEAHYEVMITNLLEVRAQKLPVKPE